MSKHWLAVIALAVLPAAAQQPPAPEVPVRTWALVSAVGGSLSYIRQKVQVGSKMEPYDRRRVNVPGYALDTWVWRGLETVVKQSDPTANIVFARLDPKELDGIPGYKKGEVAMGKLAKALESMPERKDWYRIVVMTPRFTREEHRRMGTKLEGIGIYVKGVDTPLYSQVYEIDNSEDGLVTPDGEPTRGTTFIAPYANTQTWVLDAQTLEVLGTSERYDYVKISDPQASELNIENAIPAARLVGPMEKFLEASAARSIRQAIGVVTVSDPKIIDEMKALPAKKP